MDDIGESFDLSKLDKLIKKQKKAKAKESASVEGAVHVGSLSTDAPIPDATEMSLSEKKGIKRKLQEVAENDSGVPSRTKKLEASSVSSDQSSTTAASGSNPHSQSKPQKVTVTRLTEQQLALQEKFAFNPSTKCIDTSMLPVNKYADMIVECVKENPVTIIVGETGSGKSTQIPQILLPHFYRTDLSSTAFAGSTGEAGGASAASSSSVERAVKMLGPTYTRIVCTQPRRVAATTIAKRVSSEMGECPLHHSIIPFYILILIHTFMSSVFPPFFLLDNVCRNETYIIIA